MNNCAEPADRGFTSFAKVLWPVILLNNRESQKDSRRFFFPKELSYPNASRQALSDIPFPSMAHALRCNVKNPPAPCSNDSIDMIARSADVIEFLQNVRGIQQAQEAGLTIPVSAARCCDWK